MYYFSEGNSFRYCIDLSPISNNFRWSGIIEGMYNREKVHGNGVGQRKRKSTGEWEGEEVCKNVSSILLI